MCRSQERFCIHQPVVVCPDDPDRDACLDPFHAARRQCPGVLELLLRFGVSAAIPKNPSKGQRATRGIKGSNAPFEDPDGAVKRPDCASMAPARRQPLRPRRRTVQCRTDATLRERTLWSGRRGEVLRTGLADERRRPAFVAKWYRAQPLDQRSRMPVRSLYSSEHFLQTRAFVPIAVQHRLHGRASHPIDLQGSWAGLCAAKLDEDVPARAGGAEPGDERRDRAHGLRAALDEERDMSCEQRLREPGPPLEGSCRNGNVAFEPGCASREDPQRADPAAHDPPYLDARDAARCCVAEHVGDRVERAARLQNDSDRAPAGAGSVGDLANHVFRRIPSERHRMRLEKTRDVSDQPRCGDAGALERRRDLIGLEEAVAIGGAVVDERVEQWMSKPGECRAAVGPDSLMRARACGEEA